MKKITLGIIALTMLIVNCQLSTVFAAPRTAEEAAAIAAEFTNAQPQLARMHKAPRKPVNMRLAHTAAQTTSDRAAFYVFNQEDGAGYVIVSADDRTITDVLGYSDRGTFDIDNINPNFEYWLNRYAKQITYLQNTDESSARQARAARKAVQVTAIAPLLKNKNGDDILWDQLTPYNNLCPMDERDNTRSYTGCVATATAQIMYKWQYPKKGTGSWEYTWENCMVNLTSDGQCTNHKDKQISADFGATTYDWANMLPDYSSASYNETQANAVATLMKHCGVACNMAYGGKKNNGSGAFTDDMAHGLVNFFGYRLTKYISMMTKAEIWDDYGLTPHSDVPYEVNLKVGKFKEYFNADLEAGRPILMGGYTSGSDGHEFVCDGRDTNGKFHINWGWSGEDNNYFELTALTPGSDDFSDDLDAVIGLEPDTDPVAVTGVTVSPKTQTIDQKEKLQLTATIAPADATNKQVTWSSDKPAVATVDENGRVTGVAQGVAIITVTTKDGSKTDQATITVSEKIVPVVECDPYSYTFTAAVAKSAQLGDYYWTLSIENAAYTGIDGAFDRGAQYGSKKNPAEEVIFTTEAVQDCLLTDVAVNASVADGGDGKLSVLIGTELLGTKDLTKDATEYSFANKTDAKGDLIVKLTNTKLAMYIKSIKTNTGTPTDVETMTIGNNVAAAVKRIENGQLVIIVDGMRFNALGQKIQ